MSSASTPIGTPRPEQQAQKNGAKKEVKILMIHGYTQSGPLFRAKTRALEKLLAKTLSPISLLPVLIYPTAPNRLLPSDYPGFSSSSSSAAPQEGGDSYSPSSTAANDGEPLPDTWAWFRKDDANNTYRLFNEGMATTAQAIREAGGIDGVCGFSQGAAMASFVAAALEPARAVPEDPSGDWARELRDANGGRPVKFAVSWSGMTAAGVKELQWLYEPKIATPTLHYIGSLDVVVDESRSRALVEVCEDPVVIVHPGGHHVPVSKEWVMPLAGFIRNHVSSNEN
ncbi:alpha/beta-hydrolase [Trichoderma citrinoviride]|uniref:Alpha/beta-hydrolase n=1 Tax=Trichoderma citrinoviride TaxID=58853 RepID=A0A2T4B635_9HYPO|nr:alpha/beta-hydrolase [Trichoderma citrinoviride]PTB64738.1 alpha/beta-hydrolase [Trichoderma citrinoviride]